MSKVLVVIDIQNDFVTGALGEQKKLRQLCQTLERKSKSMQIEVIGLFFTRDTHRENYLETPEGKKLPVKHCIKGTDGWQIVPGLEVENCEYINKPTFWLAELEWICCR